MILDARKLDCPKPVLETKKVLDKIDSGMVVTIVKGTTAKENMRKFLTTKNYEYTLKENLVEDEYEYTIVKGEYKEINNNETEDKIVHKATTSILVGSDVFGNGDEELGKILMKSFFFTLSESDDLPKSIAFVNRGVFLTIDSSHILESLKVLVEKGVEIVSCGTCLDYYSLTDRLSIGSISNMYTILEGMQGTSKNIRI